MVIAGGVHAAFAKLGIGNGPDYYPYDPYTNPEPTSRLRRVSSHLSVRQRKPSIVETACLSVHKIPAIVAVSGSPDAPTSRVRLPSGASPSGTSRNPRHSIAAAGWHRIVSLDDTSTNRAFLEQSAPPNTDASVATRADRSNTTPAPINLPPSYDFCDLDQNKPPHSAPSQETAFRIPNIQVTTAGQRPTEARYHYASPVTTTSYDFTDLDHGSAVALSVPRSSSPSPSSMRRSPSPVMGLSYGSVSPTLGHMPHYTGPQRHDSPFRASHTPPLPPTNFASSTDRAVMTESYNRIGMYQPSLTSPHDNSRYGAYYCTSPMPIFSYESTRGTSRRNTYDPRRGDSYDATEGGAYASSYDTMQVQGGIYDPPRHDGSTYMPHGRQTGLTSIIRDMENYNRDHMSRPVPAPIPSPTATVSVDGTLDSPYLDPERDTAFPSPL